MLFHITMTHTEDNCAIYHQEMMPGVLEAFENLEALGEELNVKLHYFTWCGPDHVAFVLLEADTLSAVSPVRFLDSYASEDQHSPSGASARHHRYGQSSDGTIAGLSGKAPQATSKISIVWLGIYK